VRDRAVRRDVDEAVWVFPIMVGHWRYPSTEAIIALPDLCRIPPMSPSFDSVGIPRRFSVVTPSVRAAPTV